MRAPRAAGRALDAHVLFDPEDARDAAQDALAKLCTKLGQFRGEAAFSTWLHRLTVNACRDVARAAARAATTRSTRTCASARPHARREAELSELRAELRDGLAGLPAAQARVLVLKDGLGFSFEEISAGRACRRHGEVLRPRGALRCASCSRRTETAA